MNEEKTGMTVDCIVSNSHMACFILRSHYSTHRGPEHTFIIGIEHVQACRKLVSQ